MRQRLIRAGCSEQQDTLESVVRAGQGNDLFAQGREVGGDGFDTCVSCHFYLLRSKAAGLYGRDQSSDRLITIVSGGERPVVVREIKLRHAAGDGPKAALIRRIAIILMDTPFQSAQQISPKLGIPDATTVVVLRLLQSEPDLFEILGPEQPPIWAVQPQAEALVESWQRAALADDADVEDESADNASTSEQITTSYVGPPLRAWQSEAVDAWVGHGHRGLVEAVTGSGKTAVGTRAVAMALDEGRAAVVLVPGIDLQNQWVEKLRGALPHYRIDRLGGNGPARPPAQWDVLVATVQTASRSANLVPPGALLVGDEVHRYGADTFAKALLARYEWRLGLTATLERSDDAVEQILLPYFGELVPGCDYTRARADGILAPVRAALTGVHFTARERARYDRADEAARKAKNILVQWYGAPEDSFGAFIAFVQSLAKEPAGEGPRHAQRFLKTFSERREILADCTGKLELIQSLPIVELVGTQSIFFTERTDTAEQVSATLQAAGLSCGYVGSTLKAGERADVLEEFQRGTLRALAAPRVLDEGIDVPDAQFGMVLAASRTRRQMIQRMGRVVRPKSDGRSAIFVVAYVYGTPEDPATGAHEAFLDELESIAEEQVRTDAAGLAPLLRTWLESAPAVPPAPISAEAFAPQPEFTPPRPTPLDMMAWMPTKLIPAPTPPEEESASLPVIPTAEYPSEPAVTDTRSAPTDSADESTPVAVAAPSTYLERVGAMLELADPSDLWAKTVAARPWMDSDDLEWQAENLYFLTRPLDGGTEVWRHTMRTVIMWAAESPDPIDEFLTVARELRTIDTDRTELLKFMATMRGVDLVDLL